MDLPVFTPSCRKPFTHIPIALASAARPFLLLLKKLESPAEWMSFGAAYLLVFLIPVFDYFPWSYGQLPGILILLWGSRDRSMNTVFPACNTWAESLFSVKAEMKAA